MFNCQKKRLHTRIKGTSTHNHLVCKRTLKHLTKIVWLDGWVILYKLSGCRFEPRCIHGTLRYRAYFEQGVLWHSECLNSLKTCIYHDRKHNTQIIHKFCSFPRTILPKHQLFVAWNSIISPCLIPHWSWKWNLSVIVPYASGRFSLLKKCIVLFHQRKTFSGVSTLYLLLVLSLIWQY